MYTIKAARKASKVIALEPENYKFLVKNVVMNGVADKVIALPVAADRYSYVDLYVKEFSGVHSLEDSKVCVEKVKVMTMGIDTLPKVLKIDRVDIVKIDVEGHENKVIKV